MEALIFFNSIMEIFDRLKGLLVFNKIEVYCSSFIKTLKADTVIVAAGYRYQKKLYDTMVDSDKVVYNVGDYRNVHNIMYAIWDSNQLAREL
ncbi:hypothetical protein [Clostridium sp.]|uniref:hypothetical protein n=1 Tax=Clostridium sp. TaxID=1506 RepID=UPI003D6CAFA7